jgi:hypothetical protein
VRKIQIVCVNEKKKELNRMILHVGEGEGKTTVSIDNFKVIIPKDKCNITKAFYVKGDTRKALTEKQVTLDDIDSIELVCQGQENNSTTPSTTEEKNEHGWAKIFVGSILVVGATIIVFRSLYKCIRKKADEIINE